MLTSNLSLDACNPYELLNNKTEELRFKGKQPLSSPLSLYILKEGEIREESIIGNLGRGGCKRAVQLSNGRALLIPNMDMASAEEVKQYWSMVVHQETETANFIKQIGLLGLRLQLVGVYPEKNSKSCVPAYVAPSFDFLKEKNIYIIDIKNDESSTWDQKLFLNKEDAQNLENWKSIIVPLAKDIAKLAHYGLPLGGDSLNAAVVTNQEGDKCIRYFGFDFSSKKGSFSIPYGEKKFIETDERLIQMQEKAILRDMKSAFSAIIDQVLFIEYKDEMPLYVKSLPQEARDLKKKLVKNYLVDIREELKLLRKI